MCLEWTRSFLFSKPNWSKRYSKQFFYRMWAITLSLAREISHTSNCLNCILSYYCMWWKLCWQQYLSLRQFTYYKLSCPNTFLSTEWPFTITWLLEQQDPLLDFLFWFGDFFLVCCYSHNKLFLPICAVNMTSPRRTHLVILFSSLSFLFVDIRKDIVHMGHKTSSKRLCAGDKWSRYSIFCSFPHRIPRRR